MSKRQCQRCGQSTFATIMSWFTTQIICMMCSKKERDLKNKLPNGGRDHEGCGYIPLKEVIKDV